MDVVITGGLGFLGLTLADRIAAAGTLAGETVDRLVLADAVPTPARALPAGAEAVALDVTDRAEVAALIRGRVAVFHLAAVLSGGGELDFDAALRVNLDGTRSVLEACRATGSRPRVVFTSTLATFGGEAMPRTVGDHDRQVPQTTYGTTKAIGELLVNDYTRKGFVDGRCARVPTVVVRPGAPNSAASGFASAVFREPLAGVDYVLPVGLDVRAALIGARTAVACLHALCEIDGECLGDDRALNLPSLSVTVGEMLDALRRVAGDRPLGHVAVEPDRAVDAIVRTWPEATRFDRALALGLPRDASLDDVVREYLADHA